MTDHSHIAMSFEANNAVGPLDCSAGGVPYNSGHIEYWKGQAREARAEITKLRAERDAAARDMRERCIKIVDDHTKGMDNEWNRNLGRAEDFVDFGADIMDAIRALPESATPADPLMATEGKTS